MTIEERLAACSRQFDEQKAYREELLNQASECLTEMTKLQGEYRLLEQLQVDDRDKSVKVSKKATEITAVPEGAN